MVRRIRMTVEQTSSDTQRLILDAAAEAFGELGFAGARVDDIAARAGVNKATVYYHIGGKDTLYAAVVGGILDRAIASLQAALAGVDEPRERFRAIVRTISKTAASFPHFAPLILREVASGGATLPDDVLRKMAMVLGIVAGVLRDGTERGEFRQVDPLVTHMIVAGGTFFLAAGAPIRQRMRTILQAEPGVFVEPAADELPDMIASLVIDGLEARPKPNARKGKETRT
jgi:TetR/AcrR family transcriptional regulator